MGSDAERTIFDAVLWSRTAKAEVSAQAQEPWSVQELDDAARRLGARVVLPPRRGLAPRPGMLRDPGLPLQKPGADGTSLDRDR